ncbi:CaiB/BaiF CoA transferase family protein [Chloroflexota bacterium]
MGVSNNGPLNGVRIVDLSIALAGPYASMLLGQLGAEVIKVETPGGGDVLRKVSGPSLNGENFYFLAVNANKKSVELDLFTKSGREAFYDLIKVSDVVLDNHRVGVLERLGANYETLKKINPRIICSSIYGYGSSGPYIDWPPCYDIIAQALTGIISLTGEPGRPPAKPPMDLLDMATGMFAASGIQGALYAREKSGVGMQIEVNMLDSGLSLMSVLFSFYFCGGGVPQPLGSGSISLAPWGAYPTRDGYIAFGVCWPRIARVLDVEWIVTDSRFSTPESRYANRAKLDEILSEALRKENTEDWMELMRVEDIPAGPVLKLDEVPKHLQIAHNEAIRTLQHPVAGDIKIIACPIKIPGTYEAVYIPPPTLGEHTQSVLHELLGYSDQKISEIRAEAEANAEELRKHLYKLL